MRETLTEREHEILLCMVEGLSNYGIGSRLHLAGNTIRWYNSQIYAKLGVNNRDEAVKLAQALGLLDKKAEQTKPKIKHNLPEAVTHFVGRRQEIRELEGLVESRRLVTIMAPGGMGKTRLSVEVARTQIGNFSDGVYFVQLAPLTSPNDIVTTVAENIGFIFYGETNPTQQLVNFLKDRAMLLILDNFEHLLDGVGLVSDIIKVTPDIKIIVTSRERLNLQSENVYHLRGLEFPTWETPEDALEYDAVKLFLKTAKRIRTNFDLNPEDLNFLARICRLSAGMPLGIELAAGWVDVLSLEQIANEIQHGIDILETDLLDIPERHRSLRATFEQTWNRLTQDQQSIFARLSVFRGGFTREAAEAVTGANIRHLHQLAQKSLIQPEKDERYAIHELLRQFGEGKLAETDEHALLQEKHSIFYAGFMAERKQEIGNRHQVEALKIIGFDYENVRVAWQYIVSHQKWDQLPKFLHSLWFYLDPGSRAREAIELLEPAASMLRSLPPTPTTELALGLVLARISWFTRDVGSFETSATIGDEALHLLRQHNSPDDLFWALFNRILLAWFQGDADLIETLSQEGLAVTRSIGDEHWEGILLTLLATAYIYTDLDQAVQLAQKGMSLIEKFEDYYGSLHGTIILSLMKELQQEYEQSIYWISKWRLGAQAIDNVFLYAHSYVDEGKIQLAQKDYAGARINFAKGLQLYWDAGYTWFAVYPLVYLVRWFTEQNELDRAVELRASIDRNLLRFQHVDRVARTLYDQLITQMEPECFAAAWERGKSRSLNEVVIELLAEV